MISLKKYIDGWNNVSPGHPVDAYRALLIAIGKYTHRAVPDLGLGLQQKLSEIDSALDKDLSNPEFSTILAGTHRKVDSEFADWAEKSLQRQKNNERDLKEIIGAMAKAVESITERDERYAVEVGDLTERLRSITGMGDLGLIRRSIVESAGSLTACVDRMSKAGKESLRRLSAEVEEYRTRLTDSERLSSMDSLTGLANRRRFEELLEKKTKAAVRFCLILIDLNDFKEVNDRLGHLAGDQVLKSFAGKLRAQFSSADLVARWGGDEFAVIVSCSQVEAEARADRMRRSSIGEFTVIIAKQSMNVSVEASMGIVQWDGIETGPDVLARADHSMYRRKQSRKTLAR